MSAALPRTTPVAVIGAGTMGAGIALVAASAGHNVHLYDAQPGAADRALSRLSVDLSKFVDRGKLSPEHRDQQMARLHVANDMDELTAAGLVIEAIIENLEIKAKLFEKLETHIAPSAILATNTSSLSITALSSRLKNPKRVVGMHFFNPAQILPLVEIVSGSLTDPEIAAITYETAKAWGKTPVHCRSTPGFIVNRVARPFYGEALRLLSEGVADPATLDAVMRECGSFRMGPFELMDLIGHDVNYAVTVSVYEAMYQDPRYKPSLIQKELVEAGLLGRKTGQGFFDYREKASRPTARQVEIRPPPSSIEIDSDFHEAGTFIELAEAVDLKVVRSTRSPGRTPAILADGIVVELTAGETATERTIANGRPTVVIDLCKELRCAPRIAMALPFSLEFNQGSPAVGLFQTIGKAVSIIDDTPGLVVMRTLAMLINEACDAVHQRIASAADVDIAMVKGVNYPIGLLDWANKLRPRRVFEVLSNLHESYCDDRYRPSPLLRRHAMTDLPFDIGSR